MQNNNRKFLDTLVSKTKIYLTIIFILLVFICIQNTYMIVPSIIIFALLVIYNYYNNNKRKSEISETLQDLTLTVDSAAKTSLINSPFPLIILETSGDIIWKSSKFSSEFANVDIHTYIQDLTTDIKEEITKRKNDSKEKNKKDIIKQIEIDNKTYKIVGKYVNSKKNKKEYMVILYFIDDTENIKLQKEYKDSKSCVGIIMVDNYEETMQKLENEEKPQVIAVIASKKYQYAEPFPSMFVKAVPGCSLVVIQSRKNNESQRPFKEYPIPIIALEITA